MDEKVQDNPTGQEDAQSNLSPEQLAELRNNMINYYNQQIPVVQVQCEYEEYLFRIEEARLKRIKANIELSRILEEIKKQPEDKK